MPLSSEPLVAMATSAGESSLMPLVRLGTASVLSYSTVLNGAIAVMFKLRRGMSLIGKDRIKGTIPLWSYVLYFPFHIPTLAYTYIHTKLGRMKPYPNEGDEQPKKKVAKVTVSKQTARTRSCSFHYVLMQ